MDLLEKLKEKNPALPLYSVLDTAFAAYGRVLELGDCLELSKALEGTEIPAEGNCYRASVPALEATAEAAAICRTVFGETEIEAGFCNGRGYMLNALEYHKSSEVNFTTRGLVLLLALPEQLHDGCTLPPAGWRSRALTAWSSCPGGPTRPFPGWTRLPPVKRSCSG